MSETFAIAAFLTQWGHVARHDLSGSDSETLPLAGLLELAEPDDLARWQGLGFGYADPRGSPWLRATIASRHDGLTAEDVLCCAGAQEAIASVTAALLEPDDHAIVVLPIYQPSEQAVTRICAATGVPLARDGWRLDIDRIAAAIRPETKLVLVNFPNSPTGADIGEDTLNALVALCRKQGLWLLNDEVYRQTAGEGGHAAAWSVAEVYERGISVNGLSKGFGLPGLRVGWAVCRNPDLLDRAVQAKSLMSSCLSSPSEVLAHVALKAERVITERTRAIGRRNRMRLDTMLRQLPDVFEPASGGNLAFAFPRYLGPGCVDVFAERLARDLGLLVLPSTLWHSRLGPTPDDHVRIGLGHARSLAGLDVIERYFAVRKVA